MATPVEMPKLGNRVEECLLAQWRKKKGNRVSAGEIIAEIETNKATFKLAAPAGLRENNENIESLCLSPLS